MTLRVFFVVIVTVLSSACTSLPEVLQTSADTNLVSYQQVVLNNTTENAHARWGGVIAKVENNADGSVIEIVHYPLSYSGRPNLRAESIGRFKALVDGFIDPLVFKQERVVTVVGSVGQAITDKVQAQPYVYPSIHVSGYHLWEDIKDIDVQTLHIMPYYRFGHGFGFASGFPYFRSPHFYHYLQDRRIRIRSNNRQSGSPEGIPETPRASDSTSSTTTRQDLPEPNVPPPRPRLDQPLQVAERERMRHH